MTPSAVLLHVDEPPVLDKMTPAEQEQILLQMRLKYSTNSKAPPPPTDQPDDLHWEITISPRVAEQGGDHRVADNLTVRIPSGTKHGSVLRVRGKGSPRPDGTCGDLYLHVGVPIRPNQRLIESTESSLNEWG